jgi:hypothetical protein
MGFHLPFYFKGPLMPSIALRFKTISHPFSVSQKYASRGGQRESKWTDIFIMADTKHSVQSTVWNSGDLKYYPNQTGQTLESHTRLSGFANCHFFKMTFITLSEQEQCGGTSESCLEEHIVRGNLFQK